LDPGLGFHARHYRAVGAALRRRIVIAVILIAAAIFLVRLAIVAGDFSTVVTAARFDSLRTDRTALRAFVRHMPKGADLHVHLSGGVYAERLIAWAVQDGLCLRRSDMTIVGPPCDAAAGVAPMSEVVQDQSSYDRLVDALSVRFFLPSPATPSAHDQFFGAFERFGAASFRHAADMTVDQLRRYQAENVQYAEFMMTFLPSVDRRALAETIKGQTDFPMMLETLQRNGLDRVVDGMRQRLADQVARIDAMLDCDAERTNPGCGVNYRYIAQISRNEPIEEVFVQVAAAAALVRAEPRVVALNLVSPEDYQTALRDYAAQMRIVGFVAKDVPVALHAGELWLGVVPPEDLTFHIRAAVEVAGARRIGHGTAIAFERDTDGLLAELRRRPVTMEISLTSSDLILNVRGKDHPLPTYLAAGVPVVLSTDDPGVERIDLSNEYFRAARDYRLGYRALKAIARNALVRSFLPEEEQQKELQRFDRASAEFEQSVTGPWRLRHLPLLLKAAFLPRR
jgi:adenosine deaminase